MIKFTTFQGVKTNSRERGSDMLSKEGPSLTQLWLWVNLYLKITIL